ncbi:hypothetical protein Tco_0486457 [Tanacetum coccineum]
MHRDLKGNTVGGVEAKPREGVMAISVFSVSLDSSEDNVGTPARRVILFVSYSHTKAQQIQNLGPSSGIRAIRGTLSKKNQKNNKHSLSRSRKMSHPADEFSQHLSDDDVSNHEDASDNGDATNKPKQQQLISTATTISNIKLPILFACYANNLD